MRSAPNLRNGNSSDFPFLKYRNDRKISLVYQRASRADLPILVITHHFAAGARIARVYFIYIHRTPADGSDARPAR